MKTKSNIWEVLLMAALLSSYSLSGNNLSAQSDPEHPEETELNIALSELEIFMTESEQSIMYKAPSGEYDEVEVALERLERLAENISNDLKYQAPDFDVLSDQEHQKKQVLRDLITQKKNSEVGSSKNQSL